MDPLSEYSGKQRKSRVNKAHSPIVENNYKARANRTTEDEIERSMEDRPIEVNRKVSRVIGMGRHRSLVAEEITDSPVTKSSDRENDVVDEGEEEVPNTLFCGCL